ncbi:hypothetical protein HX057_01800 [Myroides odoratimimus]|uniref:Uncharacterized protein n=1 Tax=Myroides odoratimimus TaxID=76832 RepID=A0AAI8C3S5_9FLAO|nr:MULTISPECIES: hypothetical protein [Myroides]ALU25417.1 hypothetical protein AS202_04280 [Myroides odoratimimus]EHO05144.1 hypothetical protein HMPREF9714_03507 [Myroides odoratimimus CCUG 12901]MCA4792747.1 hypothetical protein [Myroides odoratimimus]MCA4805920.1 hypothetical protein [Myroides odoratimimus]MCA4820093.1 hypothetical protein [Myroides odoratimimus]
MEWNKIDKQWKDSLADREIAPSSQAWDKLSSQLDQQAKAKNKSNVKWWIGLAASLLIGGFSVVQFITTDVDNQVTPSIELPTVKEVENTLVEQETPKADTIYNQEKITAPRTSPVITKEELNTLKQEHKQLANDNIMVDTISPLKPQNLQEVFIGPVMNKPSKRIVVNSDDLLNQVEGEIEIEYRESVIKKIYDKTKKVIVERSN